MLRTEAIRPDAADAGEASTSTQEADLNRTLAEYLQLEPKYQPRLCLPVESENGEVTIGARDGAAHVLRCLKVWFDLPVDVLVDAINLFDRFLTKMKVRPCHVPCITVACMNVAVADHAARERQPRTVSVEELVSVSQSACTAGDVTRMSGVLRDKLQGAAPAPAPTPARWARLLRACLTAGLRPPSCPESELMKLVEIAVCDAQCVNARTCELALVLLFHLIEQEVMEESQGPNGPPDMYHLQEIAAQIQAYCNMSAASVSGAAVAAGAAIARYEARGAAPQRQRLVWRLSERTRRLLRPTARLPRPLPTIAEGQPRHRSASESSEGEDTRDWPRSPVLPVYCDN